MQDDCYLITADGWKQGAQPREIVQVKNKKTSSFGRRSTTSSAASAASSPILFRPSILIDRYFTAEA